MARRRFYTIGEIDREIHRLSEERRRCFQRLSAEFSDGRGLFSPEYQALRHQIRVLGEDINALYAEKRAMIARAEWERPHLAELRAPQRDLTQQLALLSGNGGRPRSQLHLPFSRPAA